MELPTAHEVLGSYAECVVRGDERADARVRSRAQSTERADELVGEPDCGIERLEPPHAGTVVSVVVVPGEHAPAVGNSNTVLSRYDDNRNGRITCSEARRHRIAPVHRSHPAYRYMQDGDGDGVVCE